MSDDAQVPQAPRNAAGTPWASPDQGAAPSLPADAAPAADPEDAIPAAGGAPAFPSGTPMPAAAFSSGTPNPAAAFPSGTLNPAYDGTTAPRPGPAVPADRVALDKAPAAPATGFPANRAPAAPVEEPNPWAPPADPAPSRSGGAPTHPASPAPHPAPAPVHDQATMAPFPGVGSPSGPASPSWENPFAPPAGHTPPARVPAGEPVPPPPIAPEGPGQAPYGYGYGYGYPQYGPPGAGHPGAPGYPGYPGYPGGTGYGWPALPLPPSNGMGTAGLVLGIISAVVFCLWPVAFVVGVLGVIFGVVGRRRVRRGEATNPGQALAGIICGAVGVALSIGMVVVFFVVPDGGGDSPFTGDDGYSTSLVVPR
ncbi:DUF4190 domain-containing protein [Streptomyces fagopyri]|uniref:DUF4190 domain-containing protein n=1 Tax=Streptomyces fagopyri TaxID=2662397 RepID=UPI003800E333